MPTDYYRTVLCPINKIGSQLECNNYRGISRLSRDYKSLSNVLFQRLRSYVEQDRIKVSFENPHPLFNLALEKLVRESWSRPMSLMSIPWESLFKWQRMHWIDCIDYGPKDLTKENGPGSKWEKYQIHGIRSKSRSDGNDYHKNLLFRKGEQICLCWLTGQCGKWNARWNKKKNGPWEPLFWRNLFRISTSEAIFSLESLSNKYSTCRTLPPPSYARCGK